MDNFFINFVFVYALMAIVALLFVLELTFKKKSYDKIERFTIIFFSIVFIYLFGGRNFSIGTDTNIYLNTFYNISKYSGFEEAKDIGFNFYLLFLSYITSDKQVFLYIMAITFIFPLSTAFCLLPQRSRYLTFFSFVSFFFFQDMGINILRQGIAVSLLLLAIVIFEKKKLLACIIFAVGISFHASIIIPLLFYFLSKKIKNIVIPLFVFMATLIVSSLNYNLLSYFKTLPVINVIFENRVENMISNQDKFNYETGFRLDFVIFNITFVLIALYYYKMRNSELPENFQIYFYTYLLTSSFFFLMFSIPFSDRYGILSWIFIPLLLSPLLAEKEAGKHFGAIKFLSLCISMFIIFNI